MSDTLNWDEFRVVRAIAETQSLYGAAERLGLNHSTMFRRLTALETRLGFKLFERDRSGYRPTPAGEDMVALATLMGDTIAEFQRRVGSQDLQLTGQVRLTTVESIGSLVMPKILADFRALYPGLQIELTISNTQVDLHEGDLDLALRVLREPPVSPNLTFKRVTGAAWAVYAASSLIAPGEEARLATAPWVTLAPNFGPPQLHRWIARHVESSRHVAKVGSLLILAELAARGIGVALLPCIVGGSKPELRKVSDAGTDAAGEIWLAAAPQALHKARVRALWDFLAAEIERRRAWFEGETPVEY
jgi:DNA-binding transcriptional LysR family regulator